MSTTPNIPDLDDSARDRAVYSVRILEKWVVILGILLICFVAVGMYWVMSL